MKKLKLETIIIDERRRINSNGYIQIKIEKKWYPEHRYIIEKFIGRKLLSTEVVHHIDRDKINNSLSNLMIFHNQKAHASFHIDFDKYGFNNRIRRMIAARWIGYKMSLNN